MARKKQIEKQEIDYSEYRKIDALTNYPWYISKSVSDYELAERKTKMWLQMQKFKRERELKEGC
ncbi:hypothetical protein [Clostridium perfringens]|uniref:hypothetical protein n=1 Tax=Clostridium perfringens TaxID=1502 RepID=UPI00096ABD78|nr:hypothetical protein [Clostridium perfringens]